VPILDTDLIIGYLRKNPKAVAVMEDLIAREVSNLKTTLFNVGELYVGIYYSKNVAKSERAMNDLINQFEILDFSYEDARTYGQIASELQKRGEIIGDLDELIASIAINHKETLITRNVDHYKRINRLTFANWEEMAA